MENAASARPRALPARLLLPALLLALAAPAPAQAAAPAQSVASGLRDVAAAAEPASWLHGLGDCTTLVAPASAPVGTASCPGVRPGAQVRTSRGACTMNFVFRGSNGRNFIGTAGHCLLTEEQMVNGVAERWWRTHGTGPVARDSANRRIGEFAYAILSESMDFALIRLDNGVNPNPRMCHFGGPTGISNDHASVAATLHHYGAGMVIGGALPARSAVAASMRDPYVVLPTGAAIFGDSGSPVISHNGRAVGVLVAIGFAVHPAALGAGNMVVTRLGPQVQRAQQRLGISLSLRTASLG